MAPSARDFPYGRLGASISVPDPSGGGPRVDLEAGFGVKRDMATPKASENHEV